MRLIHPGIILLLLCSPAQAQHHVCDGIIQNLPCGTPAQKSENVVSTGLADSMDAGGIFQKRKLISEFQNSISTAKKTITIKFDGLSPQEFCLKESTSVDDCEAELKKYEQKLHSAVALKRKLSEVEEDQNKVEQNEQNQVIIIREHQLPYWRKRHENSVHEEHAAPQEESPPEQDSLTNPATSKQSVVIPGKK